MLKPNNSWMWYFDLKDNSLMLDLGSDMVFRVGIPAKHLIPSASEQCEFTVDDASIFQNYKENVSHLEISEPRKAELALNAVAASRFHKPMMPKSWFFDTQSVSCEPENGDIVTLQTPLGMAKFIVIENSGCASLCMMVDVEPLALSSTKEMRFCDTIKVMNDRITAYEEDVMLNLALVG
ncbi:cell division protein ZapC [Photobacterium indicum]|uniref:Cell division protein ZapC n=1 Tax=Photobacterium indicum TaxID=81447 RepID=A0A2T3L2P8_9GAMM|nr:cell division protein ZapC [Photobacterium indicum]PSV43158.1 cell division protein ZapC [Photobacterium indicum]